MSPVKKENFNPIVNLIEKVSKEHALEQIKKLFYDIIEQSPLGIVIFSIDNIIECVNSSFCHATGFDFDDLIGKSYHDFCFGGESVVSVYNMQQLLRNQKEIYQTEKYCLRKDMSELPVRITYFVIRDIKDDAPLFFISYVEDMTENKNCEKEKKIISENEALIKNVIENSPIGITIQAIDGRFLSVNRSACEMCGYTQEDLQKTTFQVLTHPEDMKAELEKLQDLIDGKITYYKFEKRYYRKNGLLGWLEITRSVIRDAQTTKASYFVSQLQEITERKKTEEEIKFNAYHDKLTGLANRSFLLEYAPIMFAQTKRLGRTSAVLFVDLDKFKKINDYSGHESGDLLLTKIAESISNIVRTNDIVARIGGDEFIIILSDIATIDTVENVAEKILSQIKKPLVVLNHTLEITASIGAAIYPRDGENLEDLINKSDGAMYIAKNAGGDRFYLVTDSIL